MGRLLMIVLAALALGPSAAHAQVVIRETTTEYGQTALLVDASAVTGADVRATYESGLVVSAAGVDIEIDGPEDRCDDEGTVARCSSQRDVHLRLGPGDDRAVVLGFQSGSLTAGDGHDTVIADDDRIAFDGEAGRDHLDLSVISSAVHIEQGPGTKLGGFEVLATGAGADFVTVAAGQEVSTGGGDDVIRAKNGAVDEISCGDGVDVVAGDVADHVDGCEEAYVPFDERQPPGTPLLCIGGGTVDPDVLVAPFLGGRCHGGAGDDNLRGSGANDLLDGGPGDDLVSGLLGDDVVRGGSGDDRAYGGRGRDRVRGGPGADRLDGGRGADRLFARGGGTDRIDCGPGNDIAYVDSRDRVRGCERVRSSGARKSHR